MRVMQELADNHAFTCRQVSQQHGLHHTHGLSDCHHHQTTGNPAARPWLPLRHAHTLSPEAAAWWVHTNSSSALSKLAPSAGSSTGAAAAAASAAISAAADKAAAAADVFRRWGITEGPLPIRRTPPYPVPLGWTPAPVPAAAATPAAAAASAAAAAAALAGAPCQCGPQQAAFPSNSMWEMAKSIRAREGLPVLWRGTSASLLIAVPMVGIYMPLYDTLLDSWSSRLGSLAPVVAGTAARTAACFCVAPFELLRTRIQASAAAGVSMRSTLTNFVAEQQQAFPQTQPQQVLAGTQLRMQQPAAVQGQPPLQLQQQQQIRPVTLLRAVPRMWTGFSATLVRDVPFSALYWALVEPLRQAMLPVNSHWPPLQRLENMLHKRQRSSSNSSSSSVASIPPSQQHLLHHSQLEILIANMVSGFVAGGIAAGATTPFDVVKTRMQIASPGQQQQQFGSSSSGSRGIRVFNILRDVYHKEGFEGLFSGLKPRAARAAPACAIVISVYELLKSYLTPMG